MNMNMIGIENIALGVWVPGSIEIGILALIAILVFGRNLPKIAKNLGSSIPMFKKGIAETNKELAEVQAETEKIQAAGKDALKELVEPVNQLKDAVSGKGAADLRRDQQHDQRTGA